MPSQAAAAGWALRATPQQTVGTAYQGPCRVDLMVSDVSNKKALPFTSVSDVSNEKMLPFTSNTGAVEDLVNGLGCVLS